MPVENGSTRSEESRIFLWGGAAVSGSGLLWLIPGVNAVFSVVGIAALVLIVSRLGYMRAFWASLGGLVMVIATTYLMGQLLLAGAGESAMNSAIISTTMLNAAIFIIAVVAPGIAMGAASRSLSTAIKTIWYGCIPLILLLALLLTFYASLLSALPNIIGRFNQGFGMMIDQNPGFSKTMMDVYGEAGSKEKILEYFDKMITIFIKLIPGIVAVGFMCFVTLGLAMAGRIGSRLKLMIPQLRPFYLWHASDWWLLPTAIGLALVIFGPNDLWRYSGGNILVVTGNVYVLTGLAIVESFFRRIAFPIPLRIALYVVIFLFSFALLGLLFLAVLGLADSRFNFRRQNPDKEDLEETKN